jgi:HSP20 family protein
MRKTKLFMSVVLAMMLGLAPMAAHAKAPDEDIRAQVKALNERIAQLEKQLAQQAALQSGVPAATPHGVMPSAAISADQYDPLNEMQRMQAFMNRVFESFDQGFSLGRANLLGPQADVKQTPGQYVVTMDLPGMEKSNINVEVKNGMLIVSGERSAQSEVNQPGQFFRQERSLGQFMRSLPLPDDAKPDDIKADYKNGVLEIKIGRTSGGKPGNEKGKRIQVN